MAIEKTELNNLLRQLCARMDIKRPVHLHYLDHARYTSPAVAGIVRPRIFLPRAIADSLTPEELEPILLHELAHIKRRDIMVNWLQVVVQAIYFFHPLVWLANREIRRLREEVCDDMAIHYSGEEKKRYIQSIVAVLKHSGRQAVWGFYGLGFTERSNSITTRVTRILNDGYRCRPGLSARMVTMLVIVGSVSLMIACSKEKPEPVTESFNYYPLKTESEWKLDGLGTTPTVTYTVNGTEMIDDKQYSVIKSQLIWEQGEDTVTIFARFEKNRVYWLIPPRQEKLMFDFSTDVNKSWTEKISYEDSSRGYRTGRIIDRNMTVKVPAGVFERCIVYEITETKKTDERVSTIFYTFWIAPDVGIIKYTYNIGGGALIPVDLGINELSSYSIPSKP